MKKILFRVDSSAKIATGHVMRCLTLAKALKKQDAEIIFICRSLEGNIIDRIKKEDFEVKILSRPNKPIKSEPENPYLEWLEVNLSEDIKQTKEVISKLETKPTLIIDHYAIDEIWENEIRESVNKIIVIDDLANRKHNCDILIDQNLYHNYQNRYDDLVPKNCQKFLGPEYAILREQFFKIKPRKRAEVKNILVCFGGIDPDNITLKASKAIIEAQKTLKINFNVIVIGAKNNHQKEAKQICEENKFEYKDYVKNMAEVMHWADLAIGAGGSMSWERCYMHLPAIVISVAENQVKICQTLDDRGVVKYLGRSEEVEESDIKMELINSYKNFDYKFLEFRSKSKEILEIYK
jgi:UDP-2,4-diacetamido-2,4,6-trideoxy-beta-L-altropyranose hydrolase